MPSSSALVIAIVSIGGSKIKEEHRQLISALFVEDELSLPDMARVEFDDASGDVLGRLKADVGVPLKIEVAGRPEPIFSGEITAIEVDVMNERQRAVIRGMDLSHRLMAGRRTEVYLDAKIGDAVSAVAGRHGLSAGTTGDLNWVDKALVQWNETDWEFLHRLASESGHEVVVDDAKKLHFRKPVKASSGPGEGTEQSHGPDQLVAGANLLRVRASKTMAGAVDEVEVRGWDPVKKEAVVARKSMTAADTHENGIDPARLSANGTRTLVRADLPIDSAEPAAAAAEGIVEQLGAVAAEIEAVTYGDPALRSGTVINIAGVGQPFDGKHTLTSCRHVIVRGRAYTTEIRSSGTQRRGLLGLTASSTDTQRSVPGVVPAVVTDLKDPDKTGRVKLTFPWLAEKSESPWCRVLSIGGGPERGIVFMPEVGDEVLVAFHYGDFRRPFVIGGLHNGKDKPPAPPDQLIKDQKTNQRIIQTREKHRIVFDEENKDILLSTGDDKLQIEMNGKDTVITVTSEGKIEITSQKDLKVSSDANVTIEAKQKLTLKGTQGVDVDGGSGNFEAKGMAAKITGSASFEASAPQAKLAGQAMTEISGGLVKIN